MGAPEFPLKRFRYEYNLLAAVAHDFDFGQARHKKRVVRFSVAIFLSLDLLDPFVPNMRCRDDRNRE